MNFLASVANGIGFGVGFIIAVFVMKTLFHVGLC